MRYARFALAGLLALGMVGSVAAQEPTTTPAMGGFVELSPEEEAALANEFAGQEPSGDNTSVPPTASRMAGKPEPRAFIPGPEFIGEGWELIGESNETTDRSAYWASNYGGSAGRRVGVLVFAFDPAFAPDTRAWNAATDNVQLILPHITELQYANADDARPLPGCARSRRASGWDGVFGDTYPTAMVMCLATEANVVVVAIASGDYPDSTALEFAGATMAGSLWLGGAAPE